ncbi:MAG: 30S ribosomal protein S4 [Planctomycetota bacterium]|nr:30S ribosomal protein S4 [Planctomycetota bacterium]
MGRYTGPKGRINRRLGAVIFENAGAQKAFETRENPPGPVQRRRKMSEYGIALQEKQKIKFYYGFREEQLRKFYDVARSKQGNTGENLLVMCECRLDNVVRRAGLALSRPQARQGIVHRHFQLNGRTVDKPSIQVKPGDVITVRNRPNLLTLYKEMAEANTAPACDWISFDQSELKAVVTTAPHMDDVSLPVEVGKVIAFLGR